MAGVINDIRDEEGEDSVFLMDAGDVFFGAPPISQLMMGESAIDIYNMLGYDVAAFGNHEFDKGQEVLIERVEQSDFPWVGANIVLEGSDWEHPDWCEPYVILSKGEVDLGVIGVDTDETPLVTLKGTTEGLEFKHLYDAVLHYYDEVKAQSDAVIVLAHMGTEDSGEFEGLQTVAQELIDAGKPVSLIIGGHQHEYMDEPLYVGDTAIIVAYQYGRVLGRADLTLDFDTKWLTIDNYEYITINNELTPDPDVEARVAYWADLVAPYVEQVVGYTNVSLVTDYNAESNMGNLVTDGMLWKADEYDDGEVNGSVDIAFTNPGGLRADIEIPDGTELPYEVTWGDTFNVMPFGNTLFLMDLTGEQIMTLLNQSATLYKGILQTAGATWYWYNDCDCDAPTTWGAYDVMVGGEPLDAEETYRVVTNNYLAGGQDGWVTFAEGTNRWDSYFDMQEGVNEYIQWYNDTVGPIDYQVEGRITKLDELITILHTNDIHGVFPTDEYRGTPEGMTYLASYIAAERAKNPNTLLLDAGDTFQGNAFAQYFRNATPNPIAGGMNLLEYDAFVIGNHEYNFGKTTFATMLGQLDFPILGSANVDDDGTYGFINDNVEDYINVDVDGLKVTIFGLTNPEVPIYELPSNIAGLTFYPATPTAASLVPQIQAAEDPDLLIALTHIGYDVYKGSYDKDKAIAEQVPGIDVIVGGHSHTKLDPAVLITSDINPEGTLVAQARAYAQYLGKVNVGFVADGNGGYDVAMREGYLLEAKDTVTDAEMVAYLDPFVAELDAYTSTEIGQTTAPLDALEAYTEETTGANVQTDAAVWALTNNGIAVDFYLSGAMSSRKVADDATAENPVTLTVDDMYTLMPYENSLVVMEMNGPQIKAVLERAYRNWWYYNYTEYPWGGYSHYTTCMLDINGGGVITYDDTYPAEPDGNNVVSLVFNGTEVDFADADTYYNVGTVNYVAAGSCNFNDDGVTLWPLDQITADTQYYVRDSVIDYITAMGTISPQVEGRLVFSPAQVTILHTNDTHAHLESFQPWGEVLQGGVARRYTAIQQVKAESDDVILVDAGDAFQGTLYFNVWQGEEEAYFMNALGYQAMAVGNHEFDSGPATLATFIGLADFPVLSANVDASAEPNLAGLIPAYTVLDVGGEQVGVFGLTTEDTSFISSPGPNVVFDDVVESAQATVTELEGLGINKIVALSHCGYSPDQALAAAVDGIDVIVSGHSHTLLGSMEGAAGPYPTVVTSPAGDPVLIVSAYEWGKYLGRINVAFTADGKVASYTGEPIFIDENFAEDPTIAADVATYAEPIEELKNTVIGQAAVNLEGTRELVRSEETNLGNLICDAMLWETATEDTQICIQNGGGIRASIPPGDVTMGQVLEVLPFGNQISTFGLTGADVWAALENGVSCFEDGCGRFPQVGGLRYSFDPTQDAGSRIVSVDVQNGVGGYDPIDLGTVYELASNNFLRGGGDGYDVFANNAIDPYDSGAVLADAVADYIEANSPVNPAVEGRITNLAPVP
jgi:2',3'-cyclic-nucleotide 2'-phosphodiesterase (5'-nucleotidase family)